MLFFSATDKDFDMRMMDAEVPSSSFVWGPADPDPDSDGVIGDPEADPAEAVKRRVRRRKNERYAPGDIGTGPQSKKRKFE